MSDKSSERYEVGYKRPPKSKQFKKGQSGNPRGRPKGSVTFVKALKKAASRKVVVKDNNGTREIPAIEALMLKQYEKAMTGDQKAMELILRYSVLAEEKDADSSANEHLCELPTAEDDRQALEELAHMLGTEYTGFGNG